MVGSPLADLRGVLPLAVAVAEPHVTLDKPAAATGPSDGMRAQGSLSRYWRKRPQYPRPIEEKRARRWSMRPLIYLLLLLAVTLPFFISYDVVGALVRISRTPAADLYDMIQALPADSVVLVAFDYDPSTAGEMNLQASAILRHLVQRRVKILVAEHARDRSTDRAVCPGGGDGGNGELSLRHRVCQPRLFAGARGGLGEFRRRRLSR